MTVRIRNKGKIARIRSKEAVPNFSSILLDMKSPRSESSGVRAIDRATVVSNLFVSGLDSNPARSAIPKATKANSPVCELSRPQRCAVENDMPNPMLRAVMTEALPKMVVSSIARIVGASLRITRVSILNPTVMKNMPNMYKFH